jgi:hypothetical protein
MSLELLSEYVKAGLSLPVPKGWRPPGWTTDKPPEPEPVMQEAPPPPPTNIVHIVRLGSMIGRPPPAFIKLLKLGCQPVPRSDGSFVSFCPVCQRTGLQVPMLVFSFDENGSMRFKCHRSGCDDKKLAALLSAGGVPPPPPPPKAKPRAKAKKPPQDAA